MMDEIRDPIKEETKDRMMEGVTRGHTIEETKDRMTAGVTRGPMNATNGTLKEEARGPMKVEMQGHTKEEEEETGDRMKETRGHTMEGHDPSRLRVRRGVGCMKVTTVVLLRVKTVGREDMATDLFNTSKIGQVV
uniref:Uncharacterized protein n=1 Tax=Octactis speculum TaxID=3111310 RepID=A0A7S2DN78_9STRA|mmetsp:Transcript_50851/g.69191  ORF Transcript_50851/g.69191 Transcript_50851/m.69191 type:complete len:135 (+) Transcript_50851:246-650(+)